MKDLILKIILILALACFAYMGASAQSYKRDGNTFKLESKTTALKDTLITSYLFQDSKGIDYPIIVNRTSGRCYVWKKSSKTGKMYKQYMKPEISRAVCKELNIAYKEK